MRENAERPEFKGKMTVEQFLEQTRYCRENNTPEGVGCVGCPGKDQVCADNIMGLVPTIMKLKRIDYLERQIRENKAQMQDIKGSL